MRKKHGVRVLIALELRTLTFLQVQSFCIEPVNTKYNMENMNRQLPICANLTWLGFDILMGPWEADAKVSGLSYSGRWQIKDRTQNTSKGILPEGVSIPAFR